MKDSAKNSGLTHTRNKAEKENLPRKKHHMMKFSRRKQAIARALKKGEKLKAENEARSGLKSVKGGEKT